MPARNSRSGSVDSTSDVDHHAARLPERADHVLRARQIDADLAADRAIDLREQRRRHLHERAARGQTSPRRSRPDRRPRRRRPRPPSTCRSVPSSSIRSQSSIATSIDLLGSPASTINRSISQPRSASAAGHRLGIQLVDIGVGNDHRVSIIPLRVDELPDAGQVAAADLDVVAPRPQIDVNSRHDGRSEI